MYKFLVFALFMSFSMVIGSDASEYQDVPSFKIQLSPPQLCCQMRYNHHSRVCSFDAACVHFVFSDNPTDHINLATLLGLLHQTEHHLTNATQDEINCLKKKALKIFFNKCNEIREKQDYFLPDTIVVIHEYSKKTLTLKKTTTS